MVTPHLGLILFKQRGQAEFRRFTAVAQNPRTVKFLPRRTSWPVSQDTNLYQALSKTYRGVRFFLCNIHATWYFVFPMLSRTRLPSSVFRLHRTLSSYKHVFLYAFDLLEPDGQDAQGDAREPAAREPAGPASKRTPRPRWRERIPARLQDGT